MDMALHRALTFLVVLAAALPILGQAAALHAGGPENDFKALQGLYDPVSRDYSGLEPGDTYLFEDIISISIAEGSGTRLWFRSTGGGELRPSVFLPGDHTQQLRPGTHVEVNVSIAEVLEGNSTEEQLDCIIEDIIIVKRSSSDNDIISEEGSITVLGVDVPLDFLPEPVDTPLVRALVVFVGWMVLTIVLWMVTKGLIHLGDRTKLKLDTKVVKVIKVPFFIAVLLYGVLLCFALLEPPDGLMELMRRIYRIFMIILFALMISRIFKKVVYVYLKDLAKKTHSETDDVLIPVLDKIVTVVVWIAAGVLVLDGIGVDVSVFIAGMGIAGLVVAFAAQDTLSNFFSGIILLIDRPFKEGDWIMMDGKVYQVKDIGIRSTRLFHSFSNQIVTIPNNRISDHLFSNLNEPDQHGRTSIEVGVGYSSDPRMVGQVLVDEVRSHPETLEDDDHVIFYRFDSYGDSSLQFSVTFWVKDFNDQWRIASELRERILYRFAREGIEIPFPQRVVHMVPPKQAA